MAKKQARKSRVSGMKSMPVIDEGSRTRGRPPGRKFERSVNIRFTQDEADVYERLAGPGGEGLSSWIRRRLREAVRDDLKAAGEECPF